MKQSLPKASGIYVIQNTINSKQYIGSAVNLQDRWLKHRYLLRSKKHANRHLQGAWNEYGENSFAVRVLEEVPDKGRLIEREQFWMDSLKPEYNLAPKAGSQLGLVHSDETKAKVSEASRARGAKPPSRKGTKLTPEQIAKRTETRRLNGWNKNGKQQPKTGPLSEEHKEKLRQAKLRNPVKYWLGKSRKSEVAM